MADEEKKAKNTAQAKVPAEAVSPQATVPSGKVTVETEQPSGETTVQTVPATQVRAAQETQTTPQPLRPRATRQNRDQRQRTRQQAQARRAEAQRQRPVQTVQERQAERQAQREASLEERSITVSLPAHTWAALDRRIERSGQDEASYFRRILAPLLR